MFSGGKRTGTEVVFMGTRSGLTRCWSFRDQLLKRYDFFICIYYFSVVKN